MLQFKVSPLENAIETLDTTNQHLKSLIEQHRADSNLRVDPLGMVLNGVVDAAVNGGIANYKVSWVQRKQASHCTGKTGENAPKKILLGKTQGIWKLGQSTGKTQGIWFAQIVNSLILRYFDICLETFTMGSLRVFAKESCLKMLI